MDRTNPSDHTSQVESDNDNIPGRENRHQVLFIRYLENWVSFLWEVLYLHAWEEQKNNFSSKDAFNART